ncbi:MAG: toll/interleukin-1 receptor domain-containing protein [Proteobacteria bacterium]|nr:toll/interleukin-1 receptor domain-containing protein [Pseudomonadota bacterium]
MNVFISYRRADTQDFVGRLADRLRQEREIDKLFLDVEEIDPGEDFKAKITRSLNAMKKSGVCLVIIGKDWAGRSASGATRLDDDKDFVRLEVAGALSSVKVIPVLVNEASMPDARTLPPELQKLPTLNGVSVRTNSFRRDSDYLIDAILARKEPSPLSRYWNRHPFQESVVRAFFGLVVTSVLIIVAAAILQAATPEHLSLNQVLGGTGPMIVALAGALLLGMLAPLFFRRRRRRLKPA